MADRQQLTTGDGMFGAELSGMEAALGVMRALSGDRATLSLARHLKQEAEEIMTDSKENEVPVKSGALKSTGFVPEPFISGMTVQQTAGYGGVGAPYALVQHERLDFNHRFKRHDAPGSRPGKAKYLEDPFNRKRPGMEERVGARVARDLGL